MKIPIGRRSLYPQLDGLSRGELLDVQFRKLKYQLEFVYRNSSFYRCWFDAHKVSPDDIKSRDDIRRLPLLTKADLLKDQQEKPPYGHRLCVTEDKVNLAILTSGTSGLGQEVYGMTRRDIEFSGSAWAKWFYLTGIEKGDVVMLTWPLANNSGPQSAFWGAQKLGANTFPIATHDSTAKLEAYMRRFKPHGLLVTPAYLTHLSVLCSEMGLDPRREFPELKAIWLATEAFPVSWAEKMGEFWDTRVHEMYGSTQVGSYGAGTCEKGAVHGQARGFMHLDQQATFYEVLNRESGEPVGPGEEGELVLTNLQREASPLIRFRTDDRVVFLSHQDCDCGRPFDALEAGTVARYDDMIKIKVQNIWPDAVDAVVFGFDEIEEYNGRVVVDERGREEVILTVEFKDRPLADDYKQQRLGQLAEALKERIGVSMRLSHVPRGSLERFVFKTRRWTDERRKGLERVKHLVSGSVTERGNQ